MGEYKKQLVEIISPPRSTTDIISRLKAAAEVEAALAVVEDNLQGIMSKLIQSYINVFLFMQ